MHSDPPLATSAYLPKALVLQHSLSHADRIYGVLNANGIEVELCAGTTSAAIEKVIGEAKYDLLIVGDKLQALTALETVAWLRERGEAEIVFVTDVDGKDYRQLLAAGAADCISLASLWRLLPIALRIAQPERSISRYTRRLERLLGVMQQLSGLRTRRALDDKLLQAACDLTSADSAALFLVDDDQLVCAAQYPNGDLTNTRIPLSGSMASKVLETQHAAVVDDVDVDPRVPAPIKALTAFHGKSLAIVPMHLTCPKGVLACYWSQPRQAFPERVAVLHALSSVASTVLENAQISEELEQRVADRTSKLEAANKELEAFAYSVSHDLRAPLRSVTGFGSILADEFAMALGEKGLGYVTRILRASDHMGELIEDLLHLSRVLKAEIALTRIDVTALCKSIAAQLSDAAPERSVEWIIEDGLSVVADKRLFHLVMENLLYNAHKFTAKKSHALIEVQSWPTQEHPSDKRRATTLLVRDNGAGFEMRHAEDQEQVFGVFRRLHAQSEFPGTGIGLAIVWRVIGKHEGKIWFNAEPDKGASFFLELPDATGLPPTTEHA